MSWRSLDWVARILNDHWNGRTNLLQEREQAGIPFTNVDASCRTRSCAAMQPEVPCATLKVRATSWGEFSSVVAPVLPRSPDLKPDPGKAAFVVDRTGSVRPLGYRPVVDLALVRGSSSRTTRGRCSLPLDLSIVTGERESLPVVPHRVQPERIRERETPGCRSCPQPGAFLCPSVRRAKLSTPTAGSESGRVRRSCRTSSRTNGLAQFGEGSATPFPRSST